ncbi:MBL fold metallo-hydrolase [Limnohabitans sp. B9-3]|uniref:MBL fold metallo-hydrolase n=1 Tax=Limnohabitans sp. B9-3 TaxID=1100707 RepID=UPI000C1EB5F1|nr:MBL fold metallo-hydrolase [Limnohabitans sp. B9-3]PIT79006.1 MBL fold metallo-hydrolase [Limnohabitans sp. B9-3]
MTEPINLPQGVTFLERGWLSSNNVLLHDAKQAVLIDSGYWIHAEQTASLVKSILGEQPLDMIINTHLHSDHCGGNYQLQSIYPKVKTRIPPGHYEFVKQWNPEVLTYTPTGQHCPQFHADSTIQSGDTIKLSNGEWQVYSAPGHDPHSVILFCHAEGILISADTLWERGFGVVFPELEGISAFDEVASTLDLIESLRPTLVLPGHGKAFKDVDKALAYARTRVNGFISNPEKHAIYAAKVLLKFKLLELQTIELEKFYEWANSCSYFHELYKRFENPSFENWTQQMCESLVESGVAVRAGDKLVNL